MPAGARIIKEVNNLKDNKNLIQFTGDELVNEVLRTLTCPICGIECANTWDVYAHINKEHKPNAVIGEAS